MYTDFGDDAVHAIVREAWVLKLTWPQVLEELEELAEKFDGQFAECLDTAVREIVYNKLEFKTPFYI